MDSMEEARKHVDDKSFMEIKYEHLCQNPIDVFRKIDEFLNWIGQINSRNIYQNLN